MSDRTNPFTPDGDVMGERDEEVTTDDEGWDYLPITVLVIVACSTILSLAGARPYTFYADNPLADFMNLLQMHVLNMFMHQGMFHYLTNMFFLVLFGGALTLLTSNYHVLGVATVSHVVASVVFVHTQPQPFVIGASLALAGIIAATVIRLLGLALGKRTGSPIKAIFGGLFAVFVVGFFLLLSVTGVYFLRITDHHFAGWVTGAVLEIALLVGGDRVPIPGTGG